MTQRFKSKTLDEKLATIDRKLNLLIKVLGIKEVKKLVIDEPGMEQRFLNQKRKVS